MKPNFQIPRWSSTAKILSLTCAAPLALVMIFRSTPEPSSSHIEAKARAPFQPRSTTHWQPAASPEPQPPVRKKPAAPSEEEPEWQKAFASAAAIPDPAQRDEALARLCYERAESDPRVALELAIGYGLEEAPGGVIGNLTQQWASVDLHAARAWVEQQPPGEIREELVARIGYLWSLHDPAAAASFVTSETAPGPAQIEAAISVLHQWRDRDPAAARAWVECFPDGPERERALHEVAELPALGE